MAAYPGQEPVRKLLARLVCPRTCGAKLRLVMSHQSTSYIGDSGEIIDPPRSELWQTCGLRPDHDGEHGGWALGFRWRLRLANWLDP